MKEIGSEFCIDNNYLYQKDAAAYYCLSGRTALDIIVKDIQLKRKLNSAYMPSYCCDSMLEPFISNGVSLKFYQITTDEVLYDYNHGCDAVLLLDFFGYEDPNISKIAKIENANNRIVIYDGTHKLNGNEKIDADYYFCSYRKWFFSNSTVLKSKTPMTFPINSTQNVEYCNLRNVAAIKKAAYLNGEPIEKQVFLQSFRKAEDILDSDYIGYAAELPASLSRKDIDKISSIRRDNAKYLVDNLKEMKNIKLFRSAISNNDTPLFVPILVDERHRDSLRGYLKDCGVFCPVHWPESKYHSEKMRFFTKELSLVCDQRYGLEEMQYQIKCIKEFFAQC